MRIWIICSGEAGALEQKQYTTGAYLAARREALDRELPPLGDRPSDAAGRPIYVSRHRTALDTAKQLYPGGAYHEDARLDELLPEAEDDGVARPLWLLRLLCRPKGAAKAAAEARADALIASLEADDADCILVTHPVFMPLLLDRLRVHGYCINRGGVGRVKALERVLITRRDMHCGGCSHNCYLSNPGCGIGRDKAMRKSK